MNIKSLPQLLDAFKDEAACVKYFEKLLWNGKPVCPHCKSDKTPYKTKAGYKCSNNECYKKFTVKVGTVLENSKIPLRTWFAAVFLATIHKKGISSVQLSIDLNVTQKTAWFMLHRIREMVKEKGQVELGNKTGVIEVDESHIGGLEANRHKSKKQNPENLELAMDGTPYNKKKVVIAVIEREGKVVVKSVTGPTRENAKLIFESFVPKNARVMTDESSIYHQFRTEYNHFTVAHGIGEYKRGDTHTNTVENFFSVLKRAIYGTYHQVSHKHMEAYLNEVAARFNARKEDPYQNFENFLSNSRGSLLYKVLIADK